MTRINKRIMIIKKIQIMLMLLLLVSCSQQMDNKAKDEQAIRKLFSESHILGLQQGVEYYVAPRAENALSVPQGGDLVIGKKEILKLYERVLPNVAGTLDDFAPDKFPIDELIISGDLAFARVTFNTIFSDTVHSRHFYILQKQDDGKWKITHDIWSNISYKMYFNFSKIRAGNEYCLKGDYKTARATYKRIYDASNDGKLKMRSLFWQSVTYIFENNITEALKLYKEYQSIAEQDKQLSNYRIWAYANFGDIHTELGDPAEGLKYYKKAIDLIDKVELGQSEKEKIIFNSIQWQANALIAQGELDQAKEILKKYEQQGTTKKDKAKEKTLNIVRARLAMAEGNDDAALELLAAADASDPMTVYYQAVIFEKKGEKEKSSELYKKLEEWTDNSINLAFVRNKMNNKL